MLKFTRVKFVEKVLNKATGFKEPVKRDVALGKNVAMKLILSGAEYTVSA